MNTKRLLKVLGLGILIPLVLAALVLIPAALASIPWPVRKAFGWCVFATCFVFLTVRIFRVSPGDDPAPQKVDTSHDRFREKVLPWLLGIYVSLIAVPLLMTPHGSPAGDWEYFAAKYEAGRISIQEYGQFPWWDPWTRGGFPLAANPLYAVFGVPMPLVLLFGTTVGLRLSIAAYAVLAAEGTRRLARLWLRDPVAAAFVGLIYAINGGSMISTVAAYDIPMGYAVLPWMLYFVFRLDQGPRVGFWLGFWGAFNLINGIAYFTVYSVLIAGVVWLRVLRTRDRAGRLRVLANSALALGVALAMAGWRLGVTGMLALDFPRVHGSDYSMSLLEMFRMLIGRPSAAALSKPPPPQIIEVLWYIGPLVTAAAVVSLRWGWRWWHTLAVLCAWLALGGDRWHQASYWLKNFPLFSSLYVVTRWRFMASLGIALAAGSTVAHLRSSGHSRTKLVATLLMVCVTLDYGAYAFEILPLAFGGEPTLADHPALERGEFVQIRSLRDYGAVSKGYGLVYGYEPIIGYDRTALTNRRFREDPEYKGEFWTDEGPVKPLSWSPNRVELKIKPGQTLHVNQNPGSWWLVNGVSPPGWSKLRCAETQRDFVVEADASGRVLLEIKPKGLEIGLKFHALGLILCGAVWGTRRFWWRSPAPAGATVSSTRSTAQA